MSRYDVLLTADLPTPQAEPTLPAPAHSGQPAVVGQRAGQGAEPASGTSPGQALTASQSDSGSDNRLVGRLTSRPQESPTRIVPRPKAFYITLRLDERLDQAVRYFQESHGITKADRSAVINALLDREDLWTDQALDRLAGEVLNRLTSRLTE